jgi:DNA-binding CsgD family transcriptional regulator
MSDAVSRSTRVVALGFDPLHSAGLSRLFESINVKIDFQTMVQPSVVESSNDGYSFHLFLLTPQNFSLLIPRMKRERAANPSKIHILVSDVPSLSFLGLTKENFPPETIFFTLSDLHTVITSAIPGEAGEIKFSQRRAVDSFFGRGGLTSDQVTLLLLIAQGNTNTEIAKVMDLSEKGVVPAIKRLALKLDCVRLSPEQQNLRILIGRRYAQLLGVL